MILKTKQLLKQELISNIIHTYGSRIILIIFGLISNILITRYLGVEEYGEYIFLMTIIITGMQFGSFGLHSANIFYVAKRTSFVGMLFKNSIVFALLSGTIVSFILFIIYYFYPKLLNLSVMQISIISILIILSLISLFIRNLLIGIGKIKEDNNIAIKTRFLSLGLIIIVVSFFSFSKNIAICIYAITLIYSIFSVWRSLYSCLNKTYLNRLSIKFFKKMSKFSFKAYISGLLAYLVFKSDLYFVNYYLSSSELGYYSLAVSFIDYIYILPTVVGTILFQKLSTLKTDKEKYIQMKKVTLYFLGVYSLFLIIIYFITEPFILLLYGKEFFNSIKIIYLLLIAIFFMGLQTIEVQYLNTIGYPKIILYFWLSVLTINITINMLFIEQYGIYLVAFSTIIAYFIMYLFIQIYIYKVKK